MNGFKNAIDLLKFTTTNASQKNSFEKCITLLRSKNTFPACDIYIANNLAGGKTALSVGRKKISRTHLKNAELIS